MDVVGAAEGDDSVAHQNARVRDELSGEGLRPIRLHQDGQAGKGDDSGRVDVWLRYFLHWCK